MEKETLKESVQKLLVSIPDYIQKVHCDTNKKTLPFKCAVTYCHNYFLRYEDRDRYPCKFHNFPQNNIIRSSWKVQCGLPEETDVSALKVCSDHFSLDDYIRNYKAEFRNPNFKRMLKPEAVPLRNLHTTNVASSETSNDGVLNFKDVKDAIDESEELSKKYEALLTEKNELLKKISACKNRNAYAVRKLIKLQSTLGKDWMDANYNKNRKNIVGKVFSNSQINLLLGKRRVVWSDDDLAQAFTLRHMGGKECYLYLKNKLNFPLPALSCVQRWAASCDSS